MKQLFLPKANIIENFLTDEEIFNLISKFQKSIDLDIQIEKVGITMSDKVTPGLESRSHYWYPGPSIRDEINSFLTNKIRMKFGQSLKCDNWHILNAFVPYGVHSDSYDEDDHNATVLPVSYEYAYTFIIPLANFDTNTIVFNEYSDFSKRPCKWAAKTNHKPVHALDHLYQKYFTHENPEIISHFTIDQIFPWKQGNLLSMSRHAFHCSDNFPAKKILVKRALVGWSYTKDLYDLR
jgi:hypothetical protein